MERTTREGGEYEISTPLQSSLRSRGTLPALQRILSESYPVDFLRLYEEENRLFVGMTKGNLPPPKQLNSLLRGREEEIHPPRSEEEIRKTGELVGNFLSAASAFTTDSTE